MVVRTQFRARGAKSRGLVGQLFWFAVVGTIGFVVDFGLLETFVSFVGVNPYVARVGSFLAAATTTWLLNRNLTFRSTHPFRLREGLLYIALMVVGASVNLLVYSLVVWRFGSERLVLLAGVVLGTSLAVSLNFVSARGVLHRRDAAVLPGNRGRDVGPAATGRPLSGRVNRLRGCAGGCIRRVPRDWFPR